MPSQKRLLRENRIEEAAYALLAERGFAGCSMLSVAKRAGSSNQTLYAWFGGKVGLMRWLVERNAASVVALLREAIEGGHDTLATLRRVGPVLLSVLVSERAVTLNRAAAADPSGELGAALAASGRESVVPLLIELFESAVRSGELASEEVPDAIQVYLGLLIGDLQIRRVVHGLTAPDERWIAQQAERAVLRLGALYRFHT